MDEDLTINKATRRDIAEYIESISGSLAKLSRSYAFDLLARLFEQAREEAAQQLRSFTQQ